LKRNLIIADYSSLQSPVTKDILKILTNVNISQYPDPLYSNLKKCIAKYCGISSNNIAVGNGADDLIQLITSVFGKRIVIPTPCFITYSLSAKTLRKKIKFINCIKKGRFKLPKIRLKKYDILWIANPNNPLGEYLPIEEILSKISGNGITIIDEAYIEFTGKQKVSPHLLKKSGLIILRSFSKGWPLAGLRVGYVISNPAVIRQLENQRLLFPVNAVANTLVPILLEKNKLYQIEREIARKTSLDFVKIFQNSGLRTSNSVTNFFCVQFQNTIQAARFYREISKQGVRILPPNDKEFVGLPSNYLRICIPKIKNVSRMKAAIKKTLQTLKHR